MATRTNSISLIRSKLQIVGTDSILLDSQVGERFDEALKQLGIDKPREARLPVTGRGTRIYRTPVDWLETYSHVNQVEYPGGYSPKQFIDNNHFQVYETDTEGYVFTGTSGNNYVTITTASNALYFKKDHPITLIDGSSEEYFYLTADGNTSTGVLSLNDNLTASYSGADVRVRLAPMIEFVSIIPGTSEFLTLYYDGGYTLDDSTDNVPDALYNALINLACSLCCDSLSAKYGRNVDSTIGADIVNYDGKPTTWREIGQDFKRRYDKAISGGDSGDISPAAVMIDVDVMAGDDRDLVFHRENLC